MSALDHALQLHGQGRLDKAKQAYLEILSADPNAVDALHYLGILEHQCGRSEECLDLLARALDIAPPQAERLNDLGNVLSQLERLDDAEAAFSAAEALNPDDANLCNNLGSVLARLGRLPEAEAAYQRALAIDTGFVPALNNLGDLYARQERSDEAAQYHCRAYVSGPLHDKPKRMLGIAYYTLNRISEAAEVYRDWCAAEPHNPVARHMLAACSGQDVPARAEDAFVEAIFDEYAENFDTKLVQSLAYRGPEYIAAALAKHLPAGAGLRVLDGGCGTGLCGPVLSPYATHLTGVDLSANMLARAESRGGYDTLIKAELGDYLASQVQAFDLIVIADVLIYFGALDGVLAAAAGALGEAGILVFTVETQAADPRSPLYVIKPSGRYRHAPHYIESCLAQQGLALLSSEAVVLREESTLPVAGLVVSAQRIAAAGI
jgi:predicted TPR repeat methyltransferase